MGSAIGDASGVNLNTASEDELEKVGGLGRERAHRLVQSRPYRTWDDVARVEGFSDKLVEDLERAGVQL